MPSPDKLHLFEEIFRHAPVACLVIDDHDVIVSANEKIEDIVGYPASALLNKPLKEFITHHLENWAGIKQEVDRVGYFRREIVFKRNDEKELNVKYEIVKIVCKRMGIYYAFFVRDITSRSKTEILYQHLFENAADFIYTIDMQGRFTSVNKKFVSELGYTEDELLGYAPEDMGILTDEDLETANEQFFKLARGEARETGRYILHIRTKDGTKITMEVRAVPILENNKMIGLQGIARDITLQKEYEQKLLLLNKDLELRVRERTVALRGALQLKEQLLADISHELRTPLSIMHLVVEDLKEGGDDSADFVMDLEQELQRLESLVDDLTLLGYPKNKDELFPFQPMVDVEKIIQETIHRLQQLIDEKSLVMVFKSSGCRMNTNPELLSRLVINLLTNAIKYSHNGGEIRVNLICDNHAHILEVQDFGIGIPVHQQKFIFERFYRADNSRTREHGGIGLGLAIVKWIVEMHKGSIEVISEDGKGALFRIVIPTIDHSDLFVTNG